ncbi:GILT-like protein 1 [Sipha flava]|uniref:GILT-like protein 1 n=1 Tax=Sipha flava TaxID=143950 RepID=A0A2S2Q4M1_9HEMI|nr:GILT-like protein 1 [Sipha flava]
MYPNGSRVRRLFSSTRVRVCLAFLAVLVVWQLFRTVIDINNAQKLSNPLPVRYYDNSLTKDGKNEIAYYLPVGIYYEALCPDSRNFILQHLLPSFNKAPGSFDIEFIPYGKAKIHENSDGSITFDCQHGPVECQANKIHSCATRHIKEKSVLIKYISCMIDNNYEPKKIGIDCAEKFNVNWNKINACSESKEGEQLLKQNGEATDKLWPRVSFIPTITINHEQPRQASVLKNFWSVACSYFPSESKPADC